MLREEHPQAQSQAHGQLVDNDTVEKTDPATVSPAVCEGGQPVSVEPKEPAERMEITATTEPIEPTDPTDPTEPTDIPVVAQDELLPDTQATEGDESAADPQLVNTKQEERAHQSTFLNTAFGRSFGIVLILLGISLLLPPLLWVIRSFVISYVEFLELLYGPLKDWA